MLNLRLRNLLVVGFALALLIATLAGLSMYFPQRQYQQLEQIMALRAAEGAREVLAHEAERLATLAADWALWNGLSTYLRDGNTEFAEKEFTPAVLANLRVHAFLLRRSNGEVCYAAHMTPPDQAHPLTPDELASWSTQIQRTGGARTGVALVDGPWLISSQPVAEGENGAGPFGRLIFARRVDAALNEQLARLLRIHVNLVPLSDTSQLEPTVQRALLAARPQEATGVACATHGRHGLVVLPDIDEKPALVLQVEVPSPIPHDAPIQRSMFIGLSGLAGLVFAGLVLGVLHRNMMARLPRLVEVVRAVRQQSNFQARVTLGGAPELVQLGGEINGLLDSAERVHEHLQSMNQDLERRVQERTAELETARAVERSAAEQDRLYRTLFDLLPSGIMLEAEDGTILDVNPALCQAMGYERSELVGRPVTILIPPEHRTEVSEHLARLKEGEVLFHEVANLRRDGSLCHMELREKAILLDNGQRRIVVNADDVTERQLANTRLRQSEQRYQELFTSMISGFALHEIVCDSQGKPVDYIFLDVNPAFCAMTGITREQVVGRRVTQLFPGMEPIWIERYGAVALTGQPCSFDHYFEALNKHFSVTAYRPRPGQFAVNFVDVTEQKNAEERLRLQGSALESAVNAIMIVGRDGLITWVNPAFTKLTGYRLDEVAGHSPRLLKSGRHDRAFYSQLWTTVMEGNLWRGELVNRRKDGTLYLEEMTITPVKNDEGQITHLVGIKQDITERRNLQQQLYQAQKMEGIGRLAGGIAHDFNNLLQAITGFCTLLLQQMGPDSPYRMDVLEIEKAARRAAALTRQLLAFSRRQMIETKVIDLNALVENLQKMLQRLIGEDIKLVTELAPSLDRVRVDPGQIEQVLVNLAINARDAMPQGGRLTISSYSLVFLKEDTLLVPEARHGRFVCLALSDTGVGMSREVIEHIFEPFYSTKGAGKGTGLGLSVVYGIVRQHEGMVHVYSQVGEGTTFRLYLPVYESETAPDAQDLVAEHLPAPTSQPGMRILLTEDEDGVRDFAVRALATHGYHVSAVGTAEEALALFKREGGRFHLLFTDVVLPDQNGLELAEQLLELKPDLRVLFTSGYMDDKSRWPIIRERGFQFLQKPYPVQDLLHMIRDALANDQQAESLS